MLNGYSILSQSDLFGLLSNKIWLIIFLKVNTSDDPQSTPHMSSKR